jgi:single-strand DNA-binding protein
MNGVHCAFTATLGQDPELKYTATGKALLVLSVAVTENRPGGDGAETTWLRVSVWEQQAEDLAVQLGKGGEVYVEGRLRLASWTAADGTERHGLNCSAWLVQPLGQIGRRAPRRRERAA